MKLDLPRLRMVLTRGIRSLVSASAVFALLSAVWITIVSLAFALDSPGSIPSAWMHVIPWLTWIATAIALIKAMPLRASAPALAVCVVFFAYMAWDDPRPVPSLAFPAIVSESSESYIAYCWLLEGDPRSRLSEAVSIDFELNPESEDWSWQVRDRRYEIEDAYAEDSLGREWIKAMASHAPKGIFPPPAIGSKSPNFDVILNSYIIRLAHAELMLRENHADAAAGALIPLLRAGFNLQRAGASQLEQLVASVLVRESCEQLERVLNSTDLSEHVRRDLATTLSEAPSVPSNVSRAILGDQIIARSFRDEIIRAARGEKSSLFPQGFQDKRFPFLTRCLINPNRTFHEHLALLHREELLAEERPGEQTARSNKVHRSGRLERTLKNPAGRAFVELVTPRYQSIAEPFWKVEDLRLELLRRLEGPNSDA